MPGPSSKRSDEEPVIEPKPVHHFNYNPFKSHVGFHPKEAQLFPMELRPVLTDQKKKQSDFYKKMMRQKEEEKEARRKEEELRRNAEKKYRVPRYPRGHDEIPPNLSRSESSRGPDVYRNILGPTPDESILAGLQTVIEICGFCRKDNRLPNKPVPFYSQESISIKKSSSDTSTEDTFTYSYPLELKWYPGARKPIKRPTVNGPPPGFHRDTKTVFRNHKQKDETPSTSKSPKSRRRVMYETARKGFSFPTQLSQNYQLAIKDERIRNDELTEHSESSINQLPADSSYTSWIDEERKEQLSNESTSEVSPDDEAREALISATIPIGTGQRDYQVLHSTHNVDRRGAKERDDEQENQEFCPKLCSCPPGAQKQKFEIAGQGNLPAVAHSSKMEQTVTSETTPTDYGSTPPTPEEDQIETKNMETSNTQVLSGPKKTDSDSVTKNDEQGRDATYLQEHQVRDLHPPVIIMTQHEDDNEKDEKRKDAPYFQEQKVKDLHSPDIVTKDEGDNEEDGKQEDTPYFREQKVRDLHAKIVTEHKGDNEEDEKQKVAPCLQGQKVRDLRQPVIITKYKDEEDEEDEERDDAPCLIVRESKPNGLQQPIIVTQNKPLSHVPTNKIQPAGNKNDNLTKSEVYTSSYSGEITESTSKTSRVFVQKPTKNIPSLSTLVSYLANESTSAAQIASIFEDIIKMEKAAAVEAALTYYRAPSLLSPLTATAQVEANHEPEGAKTQKPEPKPTLEAKKSVSLKISDGSEASLPFETPRGPSKVPSANKIEMQRKAVCSGRTICPTKKECTIVKTDLMNYYRTGRQICKDATKCPTQKECLKLMNLVREKSDENDYNSQGPQQLAMIPCPAAEKRNPKDMPEIDRKKKFIHCPAGIAMAEGRVSDGFIPKMMPRKLGGIKLERYVKPRLVHRQVQSYESSKSLSRIDLKAHLLDTDVHKTVIGVQAEAPMMKRTVQVVQGVPQVTPKKPLGIQKANDKSSGTNEMPRMSQVLLQIPEVHHISQVQQMSQVHIKPRQQTSQVYQMPQVPIMPQISQTPRLQQTSQVYQMPEVPTMTQVCQTPRAQQTSQVYQMPEVPEIPHDSSKMSQVPQTSQVYQMPEVPKMTRVSETFRAQQTAQVYQMPEVPEMPHEAYEIPQVTQEVSEQPYAISLMPQLAEMPKVSRVSGNQSSLMLQQTPATLQKHQTAEVFRVSGKESAPLLQQAPATLQKHQATDVSRLSGDQSELTLQQSPATLQKHQVAEVSQIAASQSSLTLQQSPATLQKHQTAQVTQTHPTTQTQSNKSSRWEKQDTDRNSNRSEAPSKKTSFTEPDQGKRHDTKLYSEKASETPPRIVQSINELTIPAVKTAPLEGMMHTFGESQARQRLEFTIKSQRYVPSQTIPRYSDSASGADQGLRENYEMRPLPSALRQVYEIPVESNGQVAGDNRCCPCCTPATKLPDDQRPVKDVKWAPVTNVCRCAVKTASASVQKAPFCPARFRDELLAKTKCVPEKRGFGDITKENVRKMGKLLNKVKRSHSLSDKCCGSSTERLDKETNRCSCVCGNPPELSAQCFPPINLPSDADVPKNQDKQQTLSKEKIDGSQKSVVVQDPKNSIFEGKFMCNKDYIFPPGEKKVKDFRASRMCVNPTVQPVVGVCTDGQCGTGVSDKLLNVRYSIVRISTFSDYTTYEILKSSAKKPKKLPGIVEGIFVTKH